MQTPQNIRRLLSCLILGLAPVAHGQSNYLENELPSQRTVTEGRGAALFAEGARGNVQWQVITTKGGTIWANLVDDNLYRGSTTTNLDIAAVTSAMGEYSYRYTDTVNGVTTASSPINFYVAPMLFPMPAGIVHDGAGGLIVSDASNHTIQLVDRAYRFGQGNLTRCPVTLVAGSYGQAGAADGIGSEAHFNQPSGLAMTGPGTFLVADTANATIRGINGTTVKTLAGSSTLRGNVDGAGVAARFSSPIGIAKNSDGSYFVADSTNHTIRKVAPDGTVSTFAGSAGQAGSADGTGPAARFNNPTGLAMDANGTLYVSDTTNNLIRKISPEGVVTTYAGVAGVAGAQDGRGNQAMFNGPTGLAAGWNGSLFVADTGNSTIRWIYPDGSVTTYAGVPTVGGLRDGVGTFVQNPDGAGYAYFNALFNHPRALALVDDLLFVADTGNAAIRVIAYYNGIVTTLPLEIGQVPVPVPTPAPTPALGPTAPTPTSSGNSSSGGGGATSEWFLAALAGAWLMRRLTTGRKQRTG